MTTDVVATATDRVAHLNDEVARLLELERRWSDEIEGMRASIAELEEQAGETAVAHALGRDDGATGSAQTLRLQELRTSADVALRSIEAARRQREAAITEMWSAEADAVLEEAAPVRIQIDERQARTNELLRALEEHEGCSYVPWRPAPAAFGVYSDPISIRIPRTETLQQRVALLEQRAANLRSRQVSRQGSVTAAAEQIVAEATADPMRIAPRILDIREWARLLSAAEIARRMRGRGWTEAYGDDARRVAVRVNLVWADGAIVAKRSGIAREV